MRPLRKVKGLTTEDLTEILEPYIDDVTGIPQVVMIAFDLETAGFSDRDAIPANVGDGHPLSEQRRRSNHLQHVRRPWQPSHLATRIESTPHGC